MTIRDVKEMFGDKYHDYEVYEGNRFHTDYCRSTENYSEEDEVETWELVDEEGYNNTILANASPAADFDEWYGDKNVKILLILKK